MISFLLFYVKGVLSMFIYNVLDKEVNDLK